MTPGHTWAPLSHMGFCVGSHFVLCQADPGQTCLPTSGLGSAGTGSFLLNFLCCSSPLASSPSYVKLVLILLKMTDSAFLLPGFLVGLIVNLIYKGNRVFFSLPDDT